MKYSKHRILPTGHIELREVNEKKDSKGEVIDRVFHRSVIAPNEPIPDKYLSEIEVDENFSKYRTQENADAYSAKVAELQPTAEEIEEVKRNSMVLEAGDFHSAINLLSFDNGEIKEVYDENGDDTGLIPISDDIDGAITQLPKRDQVKYSKLLENRNKFRRTNDEVIQIGTAIGMNDDQLDEFFERATNV